MSIGGIIKGLTREVDQYDGKVRAGIWKSTNYEDGYKLSSFWENCVQYQ